MRRPAEVVFGEMRPARAPRVMAEPFPPPQEIPRPWCRELFACFTPLGRAEFRGLYRAFRALVGRDDARHDVAAVAVVKIRSELRRRGEVL